MNLEKRAITGDLRFKLRWPAALAGDPLATLALQAVNHVDLPVPEPGQVLKGAEVAFGLWGIAQHCVTGTNVLRLRAASQSGVRVDCNDSLDVDFTR